MPSELPATGATGAVPLRAVALTRRYLDPQAAWRASDEAELRALHQASPAAAAHHRAVVVRHRLLAGGEPGLPSGFEQRRMGEATIERTLSAEFAAAKARRVRQLWGFVTALGAALLVFIVTRPGKRDGEGRAAEDPGDWMQARGLGEDAWQARVGLGVSGVTEDDHEYEAIATAELFADDWLRLSYTNEKSELGFIFVVGLQPDRPAGERIVWIAPNADERESLPIAIARMKTLPFEVRVGAHHTPGRTRIVALFTTRPRTLAEVATAIEGATDGVAAGGGELGAELRQRLGLGSEEVVQVLDTRIVPGSASDHEPSPLPNPEPPGLAPKDGPR